MQPLRFDYAIKIAHYLHVYFGLSRRGALEFAFRQESEFLTEYYFGGTIGGKFWQNAGRWYVAGYSPHLTPQHEVMITLINIKLAALKLKYEKKLASEDEKKRNESAWIIHPEVDVLRTQCRKELDDLHATR